MAGISNLIAGASRLALGAGKEIGRGILGNAAGGLTGSALSMLMPTFGLGRHNPSDFPYRPGYDVVANEDNEPRRR